MIKKAVILTLLCLVVSLWPGDAAGMRLGDHGQRHIGGLARAAILVTTARAREHGGSVHEHQAGAVSPYPGIVLTGPCRASAAGAFYTLPSHRIATHLSI